jgi:hypothetical protein
MYFHLCNHYSSGHRTGTCCLRIIRHRRGTKPPLIVTLPQHPRHDQQRIITLHVNIDSRIYIRYQRIPLTRPIARHLIRRPVKDILQSTLSHYKPSSPSPGDPLQKIFRIVIFRLQEESAVVEEIVGQFQIIVCFGLKPISRLIVSFLARRALAPAGTRDLYFIMSVIFVEMYVCMYSFVHAL